MWKKSKRNRRCKYCEEPAEKNESGDEFFKNIMENEEKEDYEEDILYMVHHPDGKYELIFSSYNLDFTLRREIGYCPICGRKL